MKLLALVLLLSSFSSLTLTEVVNSFKQSCPTFFIRNPEKQNDIIIPTIFTGHQYKKICQRWNNGYRFATVYDTVRRIPVYSAYNFLKEEIKTENREWKIEPQLEDIEEYKTEREMMDSPRDPVTVRRIKNQAVDLDYAGSWYDRGHVFPYSFAADQNQADSTCTLTNVAPQTRNSNGEWANQVEIPMKHEINNDCRLDQNHQAYIVTGVVPGEKWISITRGDQVITEGINVPSYFWSAFYCTSKTDINKLIGKAYIAEQDNFNVRKPSIDKLNERLTELYGKDFSVFPGLTFQKLELKIGSELINSFFESFINFLYSLYSQVAGELKFST